MDALLLPDLVEQDTSKVEFRSLELEGSRVVYLRKKWVSEETPPSQRQIELCGNDPSAGSPTETLLRLHLPLNVEV